MKHLKLDILFKMWKHLLIEKSPPHQSSQRSAYQSILPFDLFETTLICSDQLFSNKSLMHRRVCIGLQNALMRRWSNGRLSYIGSLSGPQGINESTVIEIDASVALQPVWTYDLLEWNSHLWESWLLSTNKKTSFSFSGKILYIFTEFTFKMSMWGIVKKKKRIIMIF